MRRGAVAGRGVLRIGGARHGRDRQLTDRDVIGVAVCALGSEGDDHVGSDAAQVAGNRGRRVLVIHLVESAVRIAEHDRLAQPELGGGRGELGLACPADDVGAWRGGAIAVPPALASGRGEQIGGDAVGSALSQHAAGGERLVVGMREHAHEAQRRSVGHGVSHLSKRNLSTPGKAVFARSGHFQTARQNGPNGPGGLPWPQPLGSCLWQELPCSLG